MFLLVTVITPSQQRSSSVPHWGVLHPGAMLCIPPQLDFMGSVLHPSQSREPSFPGASFGCWMDNPHYHLGLRACEIAHGSTYSVPPSPEMNCLQQGIEGSCGWSQLWAFGKAGDLQQPQLDLYKDINKIQDVLVLKALHNCKLLLSETAFARCDLNSRAVWGKFETLAQCGGGSCKELHNNLAKLSLVFSAARAQQISSGKLWKGSGQNPTPKYRFLCPISLYSHESSFFAQKHQATVLACEGAVLWAPHHEQ